MKMIKALSSVLLSSAILAGCTGVSMKTQNLDESEYTVIGPGHATATGIMLFNFIPIQQNDRFVRAQNAAIASRGGDAMINVEVQEDWFWAWVLNGYQTTVSGDVVKLK
ncbi:hypothetical protein PE36_08936 [Moritella sp. PE36]|uniref:hypothetical protein n=1 Tax=Moritella sp. PE36 TaxID=58051 RepID=UPI0001569B5F|nr:hypothetical protein [Moritella sp. PE36]EDM65418.1 hypothetical protein PE36_08936 [Moritella sp. PE36]